MTLAQDLLLTDLELLNPDPEKGQLLQISAVLLDAKNLLEKKFFNSYIRPAFGDTSLPTCAKMLGISPEALKNSPRQADCLQQYFLEFKDTFQFASMGVEVFIALNAGCKRSGVKKKIESPIFDTWTVLYLGTSRVGVHKLPNLETMAEGFKLGLQNQHNSMERVRLTAELLRKVL